MKVIEGMKQIKDLQIKAEDLRKKPALDLDALKRDHVDIMLALIERLQSAELGLAMGQLNYDEQVRRAERAEADQAQLTMLIAAALRDQVVGPGWIRDARAALEKK